jgi:hypothetical protein
MTVMGFFKNDPVEPGRWVVDEVTFPISPSKNTLQRALNNGEANGYELRNMAVYPNAIFLVWDRHPR